MRPLLELHTLSVSNVLPTQSTDALGHEFQVTIRLRVRNRNRFEKLFIDGIREPMVEWNENFLWYRLNETTNQWQHIGHDYGAFINVYERKPDSKTFYPWREKYQAATIGANNPPPALRKMSTNSEARDWIAKNGFEWLITITDTPGLGVEGGSSVITPLVTGNTKRRVTRFNIGLAGSEQRVIATQILEMVNGNYTIHEFLLEDIAQANLNDASYFNRFRKTATA